MNIGIDARTAVGSRSGVGNYLLNVVRAGAFAGDIVYAYYRPADGDPPTVERDDTTVVWRALPGDRPETLLGAAAPVWWVNWTLRRALQRDGVDCFFGPNFVKPLGIKVPSVVVVHDLIHRLFPSAQPQSYRMYLRVFLTLSLRTATRVITVSKHTKSDLQRLHSVAENRLSVATPAADDRFRPRELSATEQTRLRDEYDLPQSFLLFVGNIEPRKNLSTLVRALQRMDGEIRLPLVVVGQEHIPDPALDELQRADDVDEMVYFPGYVPDDDLPLLYNLATAFVYPSLYEGFGIPPLEAMQSGTPVVVSDRASLPEVVDDAGMTVDPDSPRDVAEKLTELLTDEAFRRECRRRGLERAKAFSWDQTAGTVSEAVAEATTGRNR